MPKVFCTGLTPLLNLCASGILSKDIPIYYIIGIETKNTEASKKEYKDIDLKKKYAQDIAYFFNYNIIFKLFFNLKVKDNDIITSNLLKFFLPLLNGQKLIIFPEGASCLNHLVKKNLKKKFFRYVSSYVKKITVGHYTTKIRWILPDRDGQIKNLIDNENLLLPHKKFFLNIQSCSKHIMNKYTELDFCKKKGTIFHPINQYLNKSLYKKWIESSKEIVGKRKLLLKAHENDYRDYKRVFENFDCLIVPKNFITLPAELIVDNFAKDYLGYYSTTMLHFRKKKINFIIPPDKKLVKISDKEFFGLKYAMNI